MKRSYVFTLALGLCMAANGQQSEHFVVNLAPTNDPGNFVGSGTMTLNGSNVVLVAAFFHPGSAFASIHGPAVPNSDGPLLGAFPDPVCVGGFCTVAGELNLTDEDLLLIRSGLTYLQVAEGLRGQIIPNPLCQVPATSEINFQTVLTGRDPNMLSRRVDWGTASFELGGHILQYRVQLPIPFGPYFGLILHPTPFGGSLEDNPVEFLLGTLQCTPTAMTNDQLVGGDFAELPQCIAQGSVCASPNQIAGLLTGEWTLTVYDSIVGRGASGRIIPTDQDRDGIPDYRDQCINSPQGALVNADGCSIEQLCPCDGPWKNHGEYINSMKQMTGEFVNAGLITEADRRLRIRHATASDCGRRR